MSDDSTDIKNNLTPNEINISNGSPVIIYQCIKCNAIVTGSMAINKTIGGKCICARCFNIICSSAI